MAKVKRPVPPETPQWRRVRELMDRYHLTAAKLAKRANYKVRESTISKWRAGDQLPSRDALQILARVFSVPIDALMPDRPLPPISGADDLSEAEHALLDLYQQDPIFKKTIDLMMRNWKKITDDE